MNLWEGGVRSLPYWSTGYPLPLRPRGHNDIGQWSLEKKPDTPEKIKRKRIKSGILLHSCIVFFVWFCLRRISLEVLNWIFTWIFTGYNSWSSVQHEDEDKASGSSYFSSIAVSYLVETIRCNKPECGVILLMQRLHYSASFCDTDICDSLSWNIIFPAACIRLCQLSSRNSGTFLRSCSGRFMLRFYIRRIPGCISSIWASWNFLSCDGLWSYAFDEGMPVFLSLAWAINAWAACGISQIAD